MIENHTLVIPTYNRPAMLKRLVGFYARRLGRLNMLVLDSSRPEVFQENAAMLASYGDWMQHLQFSGDVPMAVKLHRGLAQVRTRYVSFCADDDLVFPGGIEIAMAFLDRSPDYVTAHGRYLNFDARPGYDTLDVWLEYAGPGNESAHPGARIFRLFQRYESLFYGMFRTPDLQDIFAGVAAQPTLHYQELFQSVATLIKGKVHRFADFYAARQSGAAAEPTRERWQTFDWFAQNPRELMEHYERYCAQLDEFYDRHGAAPRLEREAFRKVLDVSHTVYFTEHCPPPYFFHDALKAYWPADHYVEMRLRDRPVKRHTTTWLMRHPKLVRLLRRQRKALRLAIGARHFHVRRLNEKARATGTRWKLRVPFEYRALAAERGFRMSCLEICSYLDEAPPRWPK